MAQAPEQIAPGVYRVDTIGLSNAISVLLIADSDGWVLVDTGVHGSVLRIQEALASLGAGPGELKRIYLTHYHGDHIGGLPSVRWWATEAEVMAPGYEARIISGERPPDSFSNTLLGFLASRQQLPATPIDRIVHEGDSFAGFRVIATPGHTNGHTSLLSDQHGILFTADAFGCLPRKIRVGVHKAFCTDPLGAKLSAEKLLEEDFDSVIFSHGKPLREGAKQRLREVVLNNRYER